MVKLKRIKIITRNKREENGKDTWKFTIWAWESLPSGRFSKKIKKIREDRGKKKKKKNKKKREKSKLCVNKQWRKLFCCKQGGKKKTSCVYLDIRFSKQGKINILGKK